MVLSADALDENIKSALGAGADDDLAKPCKKRLIYFS